MGNGGVFKNGEMGLGNRGSEAIRERSFEPTKLKFGFLNVVKEKRSL